MHFPVTLSLFALAVSRATAWGTVGHATVATIAKNFLTSEATGFVSSVLGSGTTMASVACWADTYRYTSAGAFSKPYHFIDSEDAPPSSCGVKLSRDCGTGGCIVSAIANYLSEQTVTQADRFLDKSAQWGRNFRHSKEPLHTEALEVGGNDIDVLWNGATTNLHHIWDTEMVEKAAAGSTATIYTTWATTLTTRIKSGTYADEKSSWVACSDIGTASTCALDWATDSNVLNCQYVLKVDETGKELSGAYYTNAVPYIQSSRSQKVVIDWQHG